MKVSGQHIEIGLGFFRVGPKPRGGDWLEDDLRALKREGFTLVASLLTVEENMELDLVDEASLCKEIGLDFYSFPIVDRSTPRNRRDFEDFATRLSVRLEAGDRGVFHCRAGLGRAPLLGCTIMLKNGADAGKAWKMLAEARGQMVPDTEAQKAWVKAAQESVTSLDDAFSKLLEDSF
jgi:protein-tyrosine phosphatase